MSAEEYRRDKKVVSFRDEDESRVRHAVRSDIARNVGPRIPYALSCGLDAFTGGLLGCLAGWMKLLAR
jgi:hypothetical protein